MLPERAVAQAKFASSVTTIAFRVDTAMRSDTSVFFFDSLAATPSSAQPETRVFLFIFLLNKCKFVSQIWESSFGWC